VKYKLAVLTARGYAIISLALTLSITLYPHRED
jgi:hypothetical protein